MAAKFGGYMGKCVAVVFTSIVAPVLVDLAMRDIHGEAEMSHDLAQRTSSKEATQRSTAYYAPAMAPSLTGWQAPQLPQPTNARTSALPLSEEVACVLAQGVGRTPEEALQDAFRAALRKAIVAQVNADTWNRQGQTLFDHIARNSGGLILSWKELHARKEWRLKGVVHHEEVSVRLDYRLLGDRLRAAQISNGSQYAQ